MNKGHQLYRTRRQQLEEYRESHNQHPTTQDASRLWGISEGSVLSYVRTNQIAHLIDLRSKPTTKKTTLKPTEGIPKTNKEIRHETIFNEIVALRQNLGVIFAEDYHIKQATLTPEQRAYFTNKREYHSAIVLNNYIRVLQTYAATYHKLPNTQETHRLLRFKNAESLITYNRRTGSILQNYYDKTTKSVRPKTILTTGEIQIIHKNANLDDLSWYGSNNK